MLAYTHSPNHEPRVYHKPTNIRSGSEVEHLPDDEEEYQLDYPQDPFERIDITLFPKPKYTYLNETELIIQTNSLHVIWMIDASVSMTNHGKIQALNNAIRETIPYLQQAAAKNPSCEILVGCIKYSHGAEWYIHRNTPLKEIKWVDVEVATHTAERTDLGAAINLVITSLSIPPMPKIAYPPCLILFSDGKPTDNYVNSLGKLLRIPWGYLATRIGVGIGKDADRQALDQFCSPEIKSLTADALETLVHYIKWIPIRMEIGQEEEKSVSLDDEVW
jgi:uncharacterized protein YegL